MAWVGDNVFSCGQAYVTGFCVNCPESSETVLTDLREIATTLQLLVQPANTGAVGWAASRGIR